MAQCFHLLLPVTHILSLNTTDFKCSFCTREESHFSTSCCGRHLLWQLTTADEIMWCCSVLKKNNFFFHLIKDEEAKMVKEWELRGERCCFFGNGPETSVSVCSDDIIFLLSCISDTLLSSALVVSSCWSNTESMIGLKFYWNCMLQCEVLLI